MGKLQKKPSQTTQSHTDNWWQLKSETQDFRLLSLQFSQGF